MMWKHCPKKINGVVGYRTRMSMINMDTWKFAHEYAGKLWWKAGVGLLGPTLLIHIPFYGESDNYDVSSTVSDISAKIEKKAGNRDADTDESMQEFMQQPEETYSGSSGTTKNSSGSTGTTGSTSYRSGTSGNSGTSGSTGTTGSTTGTSTGSGTSTGTGSGTTGSTGTTGNGTSTGDTSTGTGGESTGGEGTTE